MLIISQRAWNATDTEALAAYVESAMKLVRRRRLDPKAEPLLLLPQAVPADDAPERDTLLAALGDIAASENVMLAGAAGVSGKDGVATVGFLLSAEGEPLLTTPKVSPDLVTGFGEDATAATGQPAEFKIASTSIGQVGILPGEDVLFAHYARALTWAGAEVILNPVAEVGDHLFESRRNARRARAWENTSYVAVAGAVGGTPNGPACSSLIDFAGATTHAAGEADLLLPDLDIERLRHKRNAIGRHIPELPHALATAFSPVVNFIAALVRSTLKSGKIGIYPSLTFEPWEVNRKKTAFRLSL